MRWRRTGMKGAEVWEDQGAARQLTGLISRGVPPSKVERD